MVPDRVVRDCRSDKITGDKLCTLMDQLVKSMLYVSAGLAPDDWPCLVLDRLTITSYIFPITLHIALLKIGRETVQVLVIRQNSLRLCPKEVIVPNADQPKQNRQVLFEIGIAKMEIHRMETFQQLPEVVKTYCTGNRQPNR